MNHACPHCQRSLRWLPVRQAEGGAFVGKRWEPFQRCPRCSGKILSNLPPSSVPVQVGSALLVGSASFAAPLVTPGLHRWILGGLLFSVLVFAVYREAKRDRATKTHPRWLAGKPENES